MWVSPGREGLNLSCGQAAGKLFVFFNRALKEAFWTNQEGLSNLWKFACHLCFSFASFPFQLGSI